MLRALSEKKRRYFYEQFTGKTKWVLFEKDIESGKIHGFTDNYIRVGVDYQPEYINQMMEVKCTEVNPKGIMQGEVVVISDVVA